MSNRSGEVMNKQVFSHRHFSHANVLADCWPLHHVVSVLTATS